MQTIDSRIISFLRFPMIVGIVLIHSGLEVKDLVSSPIYDYLVVKGIVGTLTRVCVPLFFLISGYLFFCNTKRFDKQVYVAKLKKRGRSLLEPYLFYNALAICVFAMMGLVKPDLQSGVVPPLAQWSPALVASLFWDYGNNQPMVPQFWFIRNLMLIVLLTPVLYWLIRKTKAVVVLVLGALWGGQIWEFGIPGTMALFFFSLGAYFALNQMSLYLVASKLHAIGYFYPLLAIIDIVTKGETYNIYLHNIGIIVGILFVINLLGRQLVNHPSSQPNRFLLASTFFIFAMHSPYNGKIVALMLHALPAVSSQPVLADLQYIFYYFLTASLWIVILLAIFALIRKVSPKLAIFLSGGR